MVKKIVLTGGPGSGKTTVLENLVNNYKDKGYKVIVVPETATEIITSGITPVDGVVSLLDFQEIVLMSQLSKEAVINRTLDFMQEEDVIIFYDRGTLDGLAYINEDEFEEVLKSLKFGQVNCSILKMLNDYDLVIDLVGSKEFYTTENNKARKETPTEAMELGKVTLKSWLGHNKLKIVLPKERMEDKTNEVIRIVDEVLEKIQLKVQRKFAVDLSTTNLEKIKAEGRAVSFVQTYLRTNEENFESRVRKATFKGVSTYRLSTYETDENGNKIIDDDEPIDKTRYETLIDLYRDKSSHEIRKIRYYFTYNGQYLTLDVFDDFSDIGILEINAKTAEKIKLPEYVSVLEDVTNNMDFLNKNIAKNSGMVLRKI